jgi:dTDP-4-amino-4,6-dideoxygalactose transaminase
VLSLAPEGVITAGTGAAVFVRERRALKALRDAVERQPRDGLLPDLNAALGLAQVRELEAFLKSRRAIAEALAQAVARSRHGRLGAERESSDVPYGFPVLVKEGVKQVRQFAMKKGVETRSAFGDAIIAFGRVPDEPAAGTVEKAEGGEPAASGLAAREVLAEAAAPNAKDLLGRCTLFPLYPTLTKRDVQLIAKVLSALP